MWALARGCGCDIGAVARQGEPDDRGCQQADDTVEQYHRLQALGTVARAGQARAQYEHRNRREYARYQAPTAIQHSKRQALGMLAAPVAGSLYQRGPEQQYAGEAPVREQQVKPGQAR